MKNTYNENKRMIQLLNDFSVIIKLFLFIKNTENKI